MTGGANTAGPVLTVTIPAYNVENYIGRTIKSLAESKRDCEIEVLIVNDGSTDSTGKIAEKFAKRYSYMRVIHQENGGHGAAINTGIREAAGKYFKLLDGDDWVDPEGFSRMLSILEQAEEDLILCDYQEVYTKEKKKRNVSYDFLAGKTLSMDELNVDYLISMHSHVFKTEVLKKLPREIDVHSFYVDMEYVLYPLPFIRNFRYEKINVYEYRLSRTGQSVSAEGFRKHYKEDAAVLNALVEYYNEYKDVDNQSAAVCFYMPCRIFDMFYRHILKSIWYLDNREVSVAKYLRGFDEAFKNSAPKLYDFNKKENSGRKPLSDIQLWLLRATGFGIWRLVRFKKVICEIWKRKK